MKDLAEQDQPPQVVICALPVEIIERVSNMRTLPPAGEEVDDPGDETEGEAEDAYASSTGRSRISEAR